MLRTGWDRIETRNILAPENIARLQKALGPSNPENVVFGFHYYYAGSRGCTNIISRSAAVVLREIEGSRPGDHFTLYSLALIAHLADVRLSVCKDAPGSFEQLLSVIQQRSIDTELVVIFATPRSPHVDVVWNIDDRDVHEMRPQWLALGDGDVYIFRMDVLDQANDGSVVSSVSPLDDRRRVHALLDAKRPTPDGRTPASGPY